MNTKYHDFIGKYLPVIAVLIIVGLFYRASKMDFKLDDFFINILFICVAILLFSVRSLFELLIGEIIKILKNKIKPLKKDLSLKPLNVYIIFIIIGVVFGYFISRLIDCIFFLEKIIKQL